MPNLFASKRYLLLLKQLLAEDPDRGGPTRIAKTLHVSKGTMSKILKETSPRGAGLDVVERAIHHLRLDPRYFFDKRSSANYHDHIGRTRSPVPESVTSFLADMGERMAPEHADEIRAIDWGSVVPSYALLAALSAELRARDAATQSGERERPQARALRL